MKIKKLLVGALAAVTMASVVGASNTPVFAAEQDEVESYAVSKSEAFPDKSLKEESTFDHNGITYTYDETSNKYYALAVSSPQNVRDLFLYSHLFDRDIDYSNLNLGAYVNVIRVMINANNPNMFYGYLTDLTKQFDLYINGQFMFNSYVTDLNIKDLYAVCPYYGDSSVIEAENLGHLGGSKIQNLYYYGFNISYWGFNASTVNEYAIQNAENEVLEMQYAQPTDLAYNLEVFYPYDGFKTNIPYLGTTGNIECTDLSNDGLMKDKLTYDIRKI